MKHGPYLDSLRDPVTLQYLPSAAYYRADLHGYGKCIRLGIRSMPCVFACGAPVVYSFEVRLVDVKVVVQIHR